MHTDIIYQATLFPPSVNHKSKMLRSLKIKKITYWARTWHFNLRRVCVCVSFACSPQLLSIKARSCDQQKERALGQQRWEGSCLSSAAMLFILLCQQYRAIHYTPVWSETHECLETVAAPRDKANCRCVAIVFKAPFCGWLSNWHSNKGQMDTHTGSVLHVADPTFVSDYGTWFCFFRLSSWAFLAPSLSPSLSMPGLF